MPRREVIPHRVAVLPRFQLQLKPRARQLFLTATQNAQVNTGIWLRGSSNQDPKFSNRTSAGIPRSSHYVTFNSFFLMNARMQPPSRSLSVGERFLVFARGFAVVLSEPCSLLQFSPRILRFQDCRARELLSSQSSTRSRGESRN